MKYFDGLGRLGYIRLKVGKNYLSGFFWLEKKIFFFSHKEKMSEPTQGYKLNYNLCKEKYELYGIVIDGCESWAKDSWHFEASG